MESLRSRSDAKAWAISIVDQVAVGQGWSADTLNLAYLAIDEAYALTPYVTDPFWGVLSDTGPEFFAALYSVWRTSSTFPDSWNKLAPVWVEAQGVAEAQEAFKGAAWQGVKDAFKETGEELQNLTFKASLGLSTIGLAALAIFLATQ